MLFIFPGSGDGDGDGDGDGSGGWLGIWGFPIYDEDMNGQKWWMWRKDTQHKQDAQDTQVPQCSRIVKTKVNIFERQRTLSSSSHFSQDVGFSLFSQLTKLLICSLFSFQTICVEKVVEDSGLWHVCNLHSGINSFLTVPYFLKCKGKLEICFLSKWIWLNEHRSLSNCLRRSLSLARC